MRARRERGADHLQQALTPGDALGARAVTAADAATSSPAAGTGRVRRWGRWGSAARSRRSYAERCKKLRGIMR